MAVNVHVDDLLLAGAEGESEWLQAELKKADFRLQVEGPVPEGEVGSNERIMYLKKVFIFTPHGIVTLCHEKYVEQLSKLYNVSSRKYKNVPEHQLLGSVDTSEELEQEATSLFRSALGVALYLAQERYDIQYATKMLCEPRPFKQRRA